MGVIQSGGMGGIDAMDAIGTQATQEQFIDRFTAVINAVRTNMDDTITETRPLLDWAPTAPALDG